VLARAVIGGSRSLILFFLDVAVGLWPLLREGLRPSRLRPGALTRPCASFWVLHRCALRQVPLNIGFAHVGRLRAVADIPHAGYQIWGPLARDLGRLS
jgi:hypothetical protein